MKKSHLLLTFPSLLIASFVFLFSCKSKTVSVADNTDTAITEEKEAEDPATDFQGAAEWEFNMTKDPVTGKIPEGVRTLELAQARAILEAQSSGSARVMANSYIFQGPNNFGGRTRTVTYDVRYNGTSNRIMLAGGVSGGVFKSTDDGATWVRKSPTGQHFSCTSIAQDTRVGFQDTWYYTTGEASGNSAGAVSAFYSGNGVYKSTDNGETWARLASSNGTALETFSTAADIINKVIVNPANGDVYIACAATIIRSQNGGTTWATVLSGTLANSAQFTDIVITSSGGRLYAAFGGSNTAASDGVWTSTTGDLASWTRIAVAGTPVGWNANAAYGRVVLALAPSNQNILYALYYNNNTYTCVGPAPEADFFKWDQGTTTWEDRSAFLPDEVGCSVGNDPFAAQGGYDLVIGVKPDDENTVFIGGTNVYRSTDGFASVANTTRIAGYNSPAGYALYANSHPDIHSITFQPGSPAIMICGNDGGIQRTTNDVAATVTWTHIAVGYRTYQYYHVAIDPRTGNNKVIGGAQDNGTTRNIGGTGIDFENVISGDGVSVGLSDVLSGNTYEFGGSQLGTIYRRNSLSAPGAVSAITPSFVPAGGGGQFITVHKLDPDNTLNLYYAFDNRLARTTASNTVNSATWTELTAVATAVGAANDITCMATTRGTYSAATASLFFGASNGKLYRMDDPANVAAATAPVDITSTLPVGFVSSIAVNPRNDDTVMVTFSNYSLAAGNIWWTGNANAASPTWIMVEDNLNLPSIRSSAIAVTRDGVTYFVGTSVGLYSSFTLTAAAPLSTDWVQEGPAEIGNAVVSSLALRPADNNLLVGTHGYGMWKTVLTVVGLPVTLTEFKGSLQSNKSVLLQWTTSAEIDSKQFELEKSFDGLSYRKIAIIPAAGNSSVTLRYNYADNEPLTEHNFYRLRMVDNDARFKLSNQVLITVPNVSQQIIVLGNPFRDDLLIRFVKAPKGKVELRLTDMGGKLVARQEFGQANQQIQFSVPPALSRGVYQLQVVADGVQFKNQVVKQ